MRVTAVSRPFKSDGNIGGTGRGGCNCVGYPCPCAGDLPLAGYILNQTTGQVYPAHTGSSGNAILPSGHYIDSTGYEWDYFPELTPNPPKQPPLHGPSRLPGFPWRYPTKWQLPVAAQPIDTIPTPVTPAPADPADDGLFWGYEPATWLWIGGGALAAIFVLPSLLATATAPARGGRNAIG